METHPYAWAFFVPFMVVTGFGVLNLLVGLVVNAMQEAAEAERKENGFEEEVLRRLAAIEGRLER